MKTEQLVKGIILLENDISTMQKMLEQMSGRLSVIQSVVADIQRAQEQQFVPINQMQNMRQVWQPNQQAGWGVRPRGTLPQCWPVRMPDQTNPSSIVSLHAVAWRHCMHEIGVTSHEDLNAFILLITNPVDFGEHNGPALVPTIIAQLRNLDLNSQWYDWFISLALHTASEKIWPIIQKYRSPLDLFKPDANNEFTMTGTGDNNQV